MLLHNHLDMIGRNEPIQRKARFWQSYVRALKGTDDIRAPEASHYSRYPSSRGIFRPLLDFPTWPNIKSIYDDPIHPSDRISVPGYRYLPISRETYGLTPRNIYPHHYSSLNRYPRTEYFYPSTDWDAVEGRQDDQKWLNPQNRRLGRPFVKEYTVGPDGSKTPLYTYTGTPIYSRGGIYKRPLTDLFEPRNWIPLSRFTRDPWWWAYPQYKPFEAPYLPLKHSPFYLRDSYLSPVKNTYLWRDHPIRPFCNLYYRYGSFYKRPLSELFSPRDWFPLSRLIRDPLWWAYPEYKPFESSYLRTRRSPIYLRYSYLSPLKRMYMWRDYHITPLLSLTL